MDVKLISMHSNESWPGIVNTMGLLTKPYYIKY